MLETSTQCAPVCQPDIPTTIRQMGDFNFERQLREDAIAWLSARTADGAEYVSREDVLDYQYGGRTFRLQPTQNGIHKPRQFSGALSIQTVYRRPGAARPYDDSPGADGVLRYKWRGTDHDSWDNRSLRVAMEQQLPIIWFVGVGMGPAVFQVVAPVYLLWEEPENQQFAIAPDVTAAVADRTSVWEASIRKYVMSQTKRRLHQPVFRSTVLRAYESRCAVCNLGHPRLLDAAHIVPDSHQLGDPSVSNGLALCKIHHAAYDARLLGISPDLTVHIHRGLLDEEDGPMLEHGLKRHHGQRLMKIPHHRLEKPSPKNLELTFIEFEAGSVSNSIPARGV